MIAIKPGPQPVHEGSHLKGTYFCDTCRAVVRDPEHPHDLRDCLAFERETAEAVQRHIARMEAALETETESK